MAEFWPENQTEPSSVKIVKPGSSARAPSGSESPGDDPPTILSSFKPQASSAGGPTRLGADLAGEMLAHFRLDDYVGVGGMGAVFRATDLRLDRPVALKILPPDQANDREIVARFQQEARAAARLDHENVARVFFVGEDHGLHFIAFEYVEGANVRDLIQQCGALPPHEVVNYAIQIAGALLHAVARGVVHRDIKPSNIIITPTGRAKLVDMGLARNFERRPELGLTQSGITLGTFDYISPEQAREPRLADVRSDIYSLGCTLFHMLTGRPPYPEGTVLQKLLKHQEEAPPNPQQFNPNVPPALASLVTRMMAKEPGRRHQTPQELLSELLELAASMGLKSTSPEGLIWLSETPDSRRQQITWGIWLGALAALVIAVVSIYWRPFEAPDDVASAPTPFVPISSMPAEPHAERSAKGQNAPQVSPPAEASNSIAHVSERSTQPNVADAIFNQPVRSTGELITLGPDQDLRAALEQAPSGSIIEITGDYRPQISHRIDDTAGIRIEGKHLVVRAAPGTTPRILLAYDEQTIAPSDWILMTLVGANVEFEGIRFEIESKGDDQPLMLILSLESSQATLTRCSFFQVSSRQADGTSVPRSWVAQLDSGIGLSGQVLASKLTARECLFAGGEGAFYLDGPAKLQLDECVVLPYLSTVVVNSVGFPQPLPAELRLTNVSMFGSGNPIFDLEFAHLFVYSQSTVFSHESDRAGTLARVDAESRLDWKGRFNLYHGVKHYVVSRFGGDFVPLAKRLSDWMELSREVEERDSTEMQDSPWMLSLSEAAERGAAEAANAFRLAQTLDGVSRMTTGARFVLPWGPLYATAPPELPLVAVRTSGSGSESIPAVTKDSTSSDRNPSGQPDSRADRQRSDVVTDRTPSTAESNGGAQKPPNGGDTSAKRLDIKKLMDTSEAPSAVTTTENTSDAPVAVPDGVLVVDPQSRAPAHFQTLAAACARAEDGSTIEIRWDGKLRESPIQLGDRHLTIRAAAGFRPALELVVDQLALHGREPSFFNIRRGSLTLKDLDVVMASDVAVSSEIWSVIASRGADVSLENCTIVVATTPGITSTVVRFLATDLEEPMTPMEEAKAARVQFQLRNSMAIGASHIMRVQPLVRVKVDLENCAIEVLDTVLVAAGGGERFGLGAPNELEMRHCTVKSQGGLVHYEATEMRAWLPRLEITAHDNILMGNPTSPWLHFKSPRPADELRGLLRWKGMNNSYDGVELVWELESMSIAGEFERYDWSEWVSSPARDELKAERSKLDFAERSEGMPITERTRDHFRTTWARTGFTPPVDLVNRGADVSRLPAPPAERSR